MSKKYDKPSKHTGRPPRAATLLRRAATRMDATMVIQAILMDAAQKVLDGKDIPDPAILLRMVDQMARIAPPSVPTRSDGTSTPSQVQPVQPTAEDEADFENLLRLVTD